ncbi:hypothetical protein Q8X07_05140 [Pseudomonas aeruginosa]|uniref:hypothetical protein n=1 Tax=Pseudomonas aeruginosa TaxID=287 RepID=UPI002902D3FA|nr:hypothetical protein [Pseudomonas aeruginosa]MDU0815797.1 hypothetical protein [Pseudomonas aeruginosa]
MTYLRYICVAFAASLATAYSTLWVASPTPLEQHAVTLPPLTINQQDGDLLLWGGWKTIEGYDHGSANAVEIRCYRKLSRCVEAYASIFHHNTGEDLEAQVFIYHVDAWNDEHLVATAAKAMAECLDRVLQVDLLEKGATLKWGPGDEGCDGDIGEGILVGDPLEFDAQVY